jgi:hypothetical protein
MKRSEAAALARAALARKRPSLRDRFWSKVDQRADSECWPWTAAVRKSDEGYGAFWLDGRHQPASRVAYLLSKGSIGEGLVVCHACDNPPCCNPDHLFLGTPLDNDRDKVRKHRQPFGEKNGFHKLTTSDVATIRNEGVKINRRNTSAQKPVSYRSIAEKFGVSECHVGAIIRNERRVLG